MEKLSTSNSSISDSTKIVEKQAKVPKAKKVPIVAPKLNSAGFPFNNPEQERQSEAILPQVLVQKKAKRKVVAESVEKTGDNSGGSSISSSSSASNKRYKHIFE